MGIGKAICRAFAQNGAKAIVIVDRAEPTNEDVNHLEVHSEVLAIRADCGTEGGLRKAMHMAQQQFGAVDVVVANAGIGGTPGGPEVANDEFDQMHQVNTMQSVWLARHAVPSMLANGGGVFVVVASAAGLLTQIGSLPYAMTKAAAVSVAEWLTITYGAQGLKVSCVCPQAVDTAMIAGSKGGVAGVDGLMQPEEVAEDLMQALGRDEFLVLPHAEVRQYMQRKANETEKWLRGMRKLNSRFTPSKM